MTHASRRVGSRSRGTAIAGVLAGKLPWTVASVGLALAVTHLLVVSGALPRSGFPTVPSLLEAIVSELGTSATWSAIVATLYGAIAGLALATVTAFPLGVIIGMSAPLYHATRFIIEFLRPIPAVAVIPLVILVSGTGFESKVLLVTFAAFFPVLAQTVYGVRALDPVAADTAKVYQLGHRRTLLMVVVPNAVPIAATGVRISASIAMLVTVSTEIIIGAPGLGREIVTAQESAAVANMYALIVLAGILGVAVNAAISEGESRLVTWTPSAMRKRAST